MPTSAAARRGHGAVVGRSTLTVGPYEVALTRKNIRRAYLRVGPDGGVCVSAPARMSVGEVARFVEGHVAWIEERRRRIAQARAVHAVPGAGAGGAVTPGTRGGAVGDMGEPAAPYDPHVLPDGRVLLWGEPVDATRVLELARAATGGSARRPVTHASAVTRPALDRAMRAVLLDAATPLVRTWEPRLGVAVATLRIHDTRSRWGSCNVRTHAVNLSLALLHHPRRYLELVVVHELTHLLEPTHNARFHALMASELPNYRALQAELNARGRGMW